MSEAIALKKYHCPACGAEATWEPARQALVCGYCGTVSPGQMESDGVIRENDLAAALRRLSPEQRGWAAQKTSLRCQSCNAISVLPAGRVAQRCDFCGSTAMVPYEQTQAPIRPECVLPFKVDESRVRDNLRAWFRSRWFAPNRLKNAALTDTVKGIYLPYWTFDAQAHSDWTAESGTYYYTTETYRDAKGQMQTRRVRHVRWWPSSGAVDHFFDDDLIPATRGISEDLLRRIEPFPTKELVPYDSGYVAGWTVEQYQIDLLSAAQRSRQRMESAMYAMCDARVPGDTHRNLRVHTRFDRQTFKHILAPVWVLTYSFGSKNYQALANGYTGAIAGHYPRSAVKIALLILFLLIVGLIAWLIWGR